MASAKSIVSCFVATDIVGKVFTRLTVVSYCGRSTWECRCICGETRRVTTGDLNSGNTKSCGCLRRDTTVTRNTTHNLRRTAEYKIWSHIKYSCHNPKCKSYGDYGGRGIDVCPRWTDSFELFLADMGPRPTALHQIERSNNELGYFPENCRWATKKEQANNTRRTVFIEHDGQRLSLNEWSIRVGITASIIGDRLRRGWTVASALGRPVRGRCGYPVHYRH